MSSGWSIFIRQRLGLCGFNHYSPSHPKSFQVSLGLSAVSRSFSTSSGASGRGVTPEQVPTLWAQAQAVCFDVDCTITKQDALDDLAAFLGKGDEVAQLTSAAMNGTMDLREALHRRLEIMQPTVDKLQAYIRSNPAQDRLVPGIVELVQELQARQIEVFLISGGFRELILPVADLLKIPRENIYANRFVYMADDSDAKTDDSTSSAADEGSLYYPKIQVRVTGFDVSEPTSQEGGKPEAIRQIRARHPFQTIVMVGDGVTDLEAVQETGGADLFIGSGVVQVREVVQKNADWFVTDYTELIKALPRYKVAMMGSGAFASAVMQMVSQNAKEKAIFQEQVDMWVYEEEWGDEGHTLTEAINEQHENPKYLQGVTFGDNVLANSNLLEVAREADLLIFCAPHQFMHRICKEIQLVIKPSAIAISLTKGIHIGPEGAQLMSAMVRRTLNTDCSVLMGANLADEIKPGGLCEATIGAHVGEHGALFRKLFETPYFTVDVITDIEGAEMSGALKNIVALAAGFADGSNLGQNAKAALMRQGLSEMRSFAKASFATVQDDTFLAACGVADLIATCYGGRNHRVAEAYARSDGKESFADLEATLLKGQKLQGVLTSREVQFVLKRNGWESQYPLFTAVHAIVTGQAKPCDIARYREVAASAAVSSSSLLSRGGDQSFLEQTTGV